MLLVTINMWKRLVSSTKWSALSNIFVYVLLLPHLHAFSPQKIWYVWHLCQTPLCWFWLG